VASASLGSPLWKSEYIRFVTPSTLELAFGRIPESIIA